MPVVAAFSVYALGSAAIELYNGSVLGYRPIVDGLFESLFWLLSFLAAVAVVTSGDAAVASLRGFILPVIVAVPVAIGQALDIEAVIKFTTNAVSGKGFVENVADGDLLRAGGLVGGWTSFGAYLSGVFAAALALVILARTMKRPPPMLAFVVAGLCVVGLITTLTFSTALAFCLIFAACSRRLGFSLGVLASALAAVTLAFVAFGSRIQDRLQEQFDGTAGFVGWLPEWVPNTIGYRVYVWSNQTIPAVLERPITGWGNKVYVVTVEKYGAMDIDRMRPTGLIWSSPESQWFWTLMNGGVLGLLLLLVLLAGLARPLFQARKVRAASWLGIPVLWLFVSNVAIGFTAITITNKGLPGVLWPLVGFVVGLLALEFERAGSHEPGKAGLKRDRIDRFERKSKELNSGGFTTYDA
ncbi:O-antigen ligase family protein [Gordonia amicalis]|uniref:O-antigen ligase family protein n=1 Tax=Gordonia amicalis TaxID=89053 RepID=UPI00387DC2C3